MSSEFSGSDFVGKTDASLGVDIQPDRIVVGGGDGRTIVEISSKIAYSPAAGRSLAIRRRVWVAGSFFRWAGFELIAFGLEVRIFRLKVLNRLCVFRLEVGHCLDVAVLRVEGFFLKAQYAFSKLRNLILHGAIFDGVAKGLEVDHDLLEVGVEAHDQTSPFGLASDKRGGGK